MALADRMKQYEAAFEFTLPASSPVILRIDGHNFTGLAAHPCFQQPFDETIHKAMINTCSDLLLNLFPDATVAYTQSDEITLVFPRGVHLHNERVQKLASLAASYCSARFDAHLILELDTLLNGAMDGNGVLGSAYFEAQFFTVPTVEEALNYLIWRSGEDAMRKSVHAFAKTLLSPDRMRGMTTGEIIETLRSEKNVVYEDMVPKWVARGCLLKRELYQQEQSTRTKTSIEERGVKEFSTENLKLVTEKYWDDLSSPDSTQLPKSIVPIVVDNKSVSAGNTNIFGPNVYIFDPSMPAADIQTKVTTIFKQMEANEFGTERYAFLFKPGTYNVLFDVGFYTQVAGLGQSPDDVLIEGGVNVPAYWMPNRNATCNFWRAFENFSINASEATNNTTTIAVSQAAPLRRIASVQEV
ncbi:tRNAHis guanylyltransferase-domain-containing protein [Annulohypoxylon moriforme]|nr:tRNAHis guanylyltransferase-domain-containing protein [Annulohypoxylon moriforme]